MAFVNVMEYLTIASAGNATDFGDLSEDRGNVGAVSSSTRGVCGGGRAAPGESGAFSNVMEYITIASTGDVTDFGDLTVTRSYVAGVNDMTRGVFAGGSTPSVSNVMDYITIASTGDAADFGDLLTSKRYLSGLSDSHGGLKG